MSASVDSLLQQFKALPAQHQIEVAQAIDRLTWAKRWAAICERIAGRRQPLPTVNDEQIDESVQEVRREKPLSARSSTRPS